MQIVQLTHRSASWILHDSVRSILDLLVKWTRGFVNLCVFFRPDANLEHSGCLFSLRITARQFIEEWGGYRI